MRLGPLKDEWDFIEDETLRCNIAAELQKVHFDILMVNEYNVYYSPEAMTLKHAIIAAASVAEAVLEVAVKMIEDDPRVTPIIQTKEGVFEEFKELSLTGFTVPEALRVVTGVQREVVKGRPPHEDGPADPGREAGRDHHRGDGEEASAARLYELAPSAGEHLRRSMKWSLLALFTTIAVVASGSARAAAPESSRTVWWATRAAAENWLLERTLVLQVSCGTPACDPPETLRYRSTVDSATCRGKARRWRSRGVTYWHLFGCQVDATPLEPDSLVPILVDLKPTGRRRFDYKVTAFDAP
jgi:hypothetical protein